MIKRHDVLFLLVSRERWDTTFGRMKRLHYVEPIVAIYAFSSFMIFPLVQQYVYRRLWQDLTNSSYPVSDNSSRCAPTNGSNQTSQHEVSAN